MIRLFAGYDPREAVGYATFVGSVLEHARSLVSITALAACGGPEGTNAFTFSRFRVPEFCGFKGRAIFVDASDMLMLADIGELDALYDPSFAVQVVKHPQYVSQHERKYIGTEMESAQSNYVRKNWASVMLFNCEHAAWRTEAEWSGIARLQFQNLLDHEIGSLPVEWNVLVDEGVDYVNAKLLHWTAGLPAFEHYRNARRSRDWFAAHDRISLAHG